MPLLLAIGGAVVAVAGLEKALQLELVRIYFERAVAAADAPPGELAKEIARVERLTAGEARHELRKLGLPADLDRRIDDVVTRRNQLVHRILEDPELVRAVASGEGIDAAVQRIEQLALDCGELAVELHRFAGGKLEARLGRSQQELLVLVQSLDPATITDPRDRRQLEAIIAMGAVDFSSPPSDERLPTDHQGEDAREDDEAS